MKLRREVDGPHVFTSALTERDGERRSQKKKQKKKKKKKKHVWVELMSLGDFRIREGGRA